MPLTENLQLLSQSIFCSGLDREELRALHDITAIRKVKKGEILFLEGDPAGGFYILLAGKVRVYKSSPEGKEFTIHQINPGQLFAEAAIFRGGEYPANCAALEDSLVAFFPKESFVQLIKESPQISLKIIGSMSSFLREFNRKVEELTLKEVPARIASYLLREAERKGTRHLLLDIPKAELAKHLGTISETLSRNLRKFKELGILQVHGKKITILDPEHLQAVADGEKI
ncbi:MAG: Crp/Fnr family transcriptional regulator [Candidatus Zixiibacteriota bacterium]